MQNFFDSASHQVILWLLGLAATAAALYLLRRNEIASFRTFIAGALIWGFVLLYFVPPHFNKEFSHSLADAFIIAALLAATVDRYVKNQVLHEVTADISKYLIGYRLPEQIQDRIRSIMQTKWVRRSFEVRIRLEEGKGESVEIDFSISDQVQNITSETQEYLDRVSFGKFETFEMQELRCDTTGATYHFRGKNIKSYEEAGQTVHVGEKVKILPVSDSDEDYRFSTRYRVRHPTASKESITFSHPTIGAMIEVTDCPEGYVFHLTPTPDGQTVNRWTYNRLFLSGEQISIQWEKAGNGGAL